MITHHNQNLGIGIIFSADTSIGAMNSVSIQAMLIGPVLFNFRISYAFFA